MLAHSNIAILLWPVASTGHFHPNKCLTWFTKSLKCGSLIIKHLLLQAAEQVYSRGMSVKSKKKKRVYVQKADGKKHHDGSDMQQVAMF